VSSRAILALSAAILAIAPVNTGLAQQSFGDPLPPPSAPGSFNQRNAFAATSPFQGTTGQHGGMANAPSVPIHDGWGGYSTAPVERFALPAPQPEPFQAQTPHRDFEVEQNLPPDEEYLRPGSLTGAEKVDWNQIEKITPNGDFARSNSAESQIGWTARGKNKERVKPRRPAIDLKEMTRLKLNESGSTVFDITKGAVITKF
jgi:hypothetical protein